MQKTETPETTAAYIKLVDALNAMESAGAPTHLGLTDSDVAVFTGAYTVTWDSMSERWTLVLEVDDLPELCPFNQTRDECRELDLCQQCTEVADRMDETV